MFEEVVSVMNAVIYADDGIIIQLEDRKIKICDSVIITLKKYVHARNEAGGILIGRENIDNNNLIIEVATEPYQFDVRKRTAFLRKDRSHIDDYEELNIAHNNIYAYIGEWHTHAQLKPLYSSIDVRNWKRISTTAPNNQCQYHLITGYEVWRLWKYDTNKKCTLIGKVNIQD